MWIEIFRTGTFTDANGVVETFTPETLDRIVRTYNEQVEADSSLLAPLVKGHPQTDSPAYGWVERLARRGNTLYAKLHSLSQEIIEDVKNGKFKKVSISLYPNLLLKHIGLLGAVSPAVKGLKPVEFVDFEAEKTFEFASEDISFNDSELRAELQKLAETNSQLSRQNQALRNQLHKLHREVLARGFREFAERATNLANGLVIPPSKSDELVQILEYASLADSFVQEDGSRLFPEDVSLVERIKNFILTLKPLQLNKEFSQPSIESQSSCDDSFAGKKFDEERYALHQQVKKYLSENPGLSYEEALNFVTLKS